MTAGDLDLDAPDGDELVVEGDLVVDGSVLNADPEEGRPLHVKGNLRARHVVVGGARVRVEGDLDADGLVLSHGGEGGLSVEGVTRARLVVYEYALRAGMPLSEQLHRDLPVTRDESEYPIPVENVDPRDLVERIRAGLPVLREADDPRPRKTYAEWLADCGKFGMAIQWVPRELITGELVDAALAETPYAIQGVPMELRTAGRCRLAVEHRARLLSEVPVELRTRELCALAIEREPRVFEIISFVPEEVLTPELCLRAAQRDGLSVSYLPERFRTFEVWVAAVNENPFALSDVPESIREEVAAAVRGPKVELTPQERALIERPSKLRLFLYFLRHLWAGIRRR